MIYLASFTGTLVYRLEISNEVREYWDAHKFFDQFSGVTYGVCVGEWGN